MKPKRPEASVQVDPGFHLFVADTSEQMAQWASEEILEALRRKPGSLLCAATGASPTRTYELLISRQKQEPDIFASLKLLKLDEWGGLPMDHPETCEAYLRKNLPLSIPPERYISFLSTAEPEQECARIASILAKSDPIDLCILGLGTNGHLALNEPADALQPFSHKADLAPSSLAHPMIRESHGLVKHGLTLGMAEILRSKKIILLVNGAHKAQPFKQLLSRQISTRFPASFLWLHPQVFCFCDEQAASLLDI